MMLRSHTLLLPTYVWLFLFCNHKAFAQESVSEQEVRWSNSLLEQVERVSASDRYAVSAFAVVALADSGNYTEARKLALSQSSDDERDSLLMRLCVSQAQKELFDDALATADTVKQPFLKDKSQRLIAIEFAKHNQFERAESLAHNISDPLNRDHVTSAIAKALASKGDLINATTRAEQIVNDYEKRQALKAIAHVKEKRRLLSEELKGSLQYRVALLTAFSKEGLYDTNISAIVAAQAGDKQSASQLIQQSLADAEKLNSKPKLLITYVLSAVAMVELSDEAAASELVTKLYEVSNRNWTSQISAPGVGQLLVQLLARLKRNDAIDAILRQEQERFVNDPNSSAYLQTLAALGEALVENNQRSELESRLSKLNRADEKAYLLMGAITGAQFASTRARPGT